MTNKRLDRVAGMMQRKLAQLIQQVIKDPRLPSLITISHVDVSRDLSHAKVYFTSLHDDKTTTQAILNGSAGYLRKLLANSISLRIVPQLHFIYDTSLEYAMHLSKLIDIANTEAETLIVDPTLNQASEPNE